MAKKNDKKVRGSYTATEARAIIKDLSPIRHKFRIHDDNDGGVETATGVVTYAKKGTIGVVFDHEPDTVYSYVLSGSGKNRVFVSIDASNIWLEIAVVSWG